MDPRTASHQTTSPRVQEEHHRFRHHRQTNRVTSQSVNNSPSKFGSSIVSSPSFQELERAIGESFATEFYYFVLWIVAKFG